MKKIITLIFISILIIASSASATENLVQSLSGKILLQVEDNGEAWYVNPTDTKKYYMGRPADAFNLMRNFGLGIKHNELSGYLKNNFPSRLSGKIMLDVENNGEAYYVYPDDLKGYYMGRPTDAFNLMRTFGLGITNNNLNKITSGYTSSPTPTPTPTQSTEENILSLAGEAIRSGNKEKTTTYFIPELKRAIEYTMDFLSDEGRLALGNILSGSKLTSSTETEKIYSNEVYFSLGGYEVPVKFYVKKQADGSWLLTNL